MGAMPSFTWAAYGPAVAPITSYFFAWANAEVAASAASESATRARRCNVIGISGNGLEESALVEAARQRVAAPLQQLDEDDEDGHGQHHHVGLEAVVAVADGEIADAAAAHDAGHRGVRQEADRQHRQRQHEAGARLDQ